MKIDSRQHIGMFDGSKLGILVGLRVGVLLGSIVGRVVCLMLAIPYTNLSGFFTSRLVTKIQANITPARHPTTNILRCWYAHDLETQILTMILKVQTPG